MLEESLAVWRYLNYFGISDMLSHEGISVELVVSLTGFWVSVRIGVETKCK